MTQDGEARASGTVTAPRRPPLRQSIVVRSDRRRTAVTTSAAPTARAGLASSAAWPR